MDFIGNKKHKFSDAHTKSLNKIQTNDYCYRMRMSINLSNYVFEKKEKNIVISLCQNCQMLSHNFLLIDPVDDLILP